MKAWDSQCCVRTGKKDIQNYLYLGQLVEFSLAVQNPYSSNPWAPHLLLCQYSSFLNYMKLKAGIFLKYSKIKGKSTAISIWSGHLGEENLWMGLEAGKYQFDQSPPSPYVWKAALGVIYWRTVASVWGAGHIFLGWFCLSFPSFHSISLSFGWKCMWVGSWNFQPHANM